MLTRALLGLFAVAMGGCLETGVPLETAAAGIETDNGTLLNGEVLNGGVLNGRRLNTNAVNGRRLNGTLVNGRRLNSATLGGTTVLANLDDGTRTPIAAGTVVSALLEDGSSATVTVESARTELFDQVWSSGYSTPNYITRYQLSVTQNGSTYPYCPNGADAVALRGRWDFNSGTKISADPDDITFACRGYALGKCVDLGYWPDGKWIAVPEDRESWDGSITYVDVPRWATLDREHQACVRAIRADYCGSGHSFTQAGIPIDISDRTGVQDQEVGVGIRLDGWIPEAEWSAEGALCALNSRIRDFDGDGSNDRPACGTDGALQYQCARGSHAISDGRDPVWQTSGIIRTWIRDPYWYGGYDDE